jgi:uncharacterized protein involved in exopolysaccharide biosynthesis
MDRGISLQETLKGLWRRRRLVLLVFCALFAVGSAFVALLPATYRATAVMQVEAYRPVVELVQPSVTQPIEERLRTGAQELLARPLLERAIQELDLFPKLRARKGMDAAVGALRAMLDVRLDGERSFELFVDGDDPTTVARIANRLPELYSESVLEVRARQAEAVARLFDEELARVGPRVEELEAQIAAFKLEHLGELPEQAESNMRGIERLTGLATARTDARRELSRRIAELAQSRAGAETELGRLRRRDLDLRRDLTAARAQFTADHPEVQRLERELGVLGPQLARAEAGTNEIDAERGYLKGQLSALNVEIKSLEGEVSAYRGRLDRTPRWANVLHVLNRDYDLLRTKYQSLLSRKVEAEVARELEAKARPGMFRVLSPASVPQAPYKPNRTTGLALVLLAAVGCAVLVGLFRELQDDSLRRAEHARELSMPLLALVPQIPAVRVPKGQGQGKGER